MEMFTVRAFDFEDQGMLAASIEDFIQSHCQSADTEFKVQYQTYVIDSVVHYTALVEVWENMQ